MLNLTVCGSTDNDLYRVLSDNGFNCVRKDLAIQAVQDAPGGSALLVLADGYPAAPTLLDREFFNAAKAKKLRLYVEFPSTLPNLEVGPVHPSNYLERLVVAEDRFGSELPPMSILGLHDAYFVEVKVAKPLLVMARVAGYQTAVYGLPENGSYPLLFELPEYNALICTSKMSQFVTARYQPIPSWKAVWKMVLEWLLPGQKVPALTWKPRLTPKFGPNEKLPANATEMASKTGGEWFIKSRMLYDEKWTPTNDVNGDGSFGALEGTRCVIRYDGTQPYMTTLRNDCCNEVAMGLAVRGAIENNAFYTKAAGNIIDYIFGPKGFRLEPNNDPASPTYGMISWSSGSREVFFGDDNARAIMGIIAVAAASNDDRWDEKLLGAILGNFRNSGPNALQSHNLWEQLIFKFGWEYYWFTDHQRLAPHFESWIMACYLWLYARTGFKPLLERTRAGIKVMMEAYPKRWKWTNGIQQERARMLLPLAWLVRVDDTPKHRAWLNKMADDMLASQDASGAIREELGDASTGIYGAPKTNEAYGTAEAPLIHKNGEPVCDLLYTSNFALVSLTEAAAATGDPKLERAAAKLEEFMVRCQVNCPDLPNVDGGWFRAFDYKLWEHWAAGADGAWGIWCIESGWTQAWIVTMLALRHKKTNFWDYTSKSKIGQLMEKIRPQFIPDRVLNGKPGKYGDPIRNEPNTLCVETYHDDIWTCYVARDLESTYDLKKPYRVTRLAVTCGYAPTRKLKLPKSVEFSVSTDGKEYRSVGTAYPDPKVKPSGHMTNYILSITIPPTEAKFVRINALRDVVPVPGEKKEPAGPVQIPGRTIRNDWLFIDELVVKHE